MIPTAKSFRLSKLIDSSHVWRKEEIMIEFAKLHCTEQAKVISQKAHLTDFACEFLQEGSSEAIDKDSILNAYPLDNIK